MKKLINRINPAMAIIGIAFMAGAFVVSSSAVGAEEGISADEAAKELANPNTAVASLTLKNQFTWYKGELPGADDQFNYMALFQPVFPFPREDGAKIIFRPAIPLIVGKPVPTPTGFDDRSGMGDIAFDVVYAFPSKGDGMLYALGVFSSLPTATVDGLGMKEWTLGPEFLVGKLGAKYIALLFPSHQWNVAGWSGRSVNASMIQAGLIFLPGGGWKVGSAPIMSYAWNNEQWTFPLNLQVGKTVMFGKSPWKLAVEINYYVDQPDAIGPEWMVGFNVTPVVQNYAASFLNDILR